MKRLKICDRGHKFYKSSDCPVCPVCEAARRPKEGFLSLLSAPARRALLGLQIDTLEKLAQYSEKEVLALHGIGKTSMPVLRQALAAEGLAFRSFSP